MVSYFLGISIKHSKVFVNYSGLLEKKERLFQYNCFHRRPVLNKENLHLNTRSENQKQKKKTSKDILRAIQKMTAWCCSTISIVIIILKQKIIYKAIKKYILAKIHTDQWHSAKRWSWNLLLLFLFYSLQNYVENIIFICLLAIKALQFLEVPFRNVCRLTFNVK